MHELKFVSFSPVTQPQELSRVEGEIFPSPTSLYSLFLAHKPEEHSCAQKPPKTSHLIQSEWQKPSPLHLTVQASIPTSLPPPNSVPTTLPFSSLFHNAPSRLLPQGLYICYFFYLKLFCTATWLLLHLMFQEQWENLGRRFRRTIVRYKKNQNWVSQKLREESFKKMGIISSVKFPNNFPSDFLTPFTVVLLN